MRRVDPYKTVRGLERALDNGGRWYDVVAAAGDGKISSPELRAAARSLTTRDALLFLHLAWADFSFDEREVIRKKLSPRLKRKLTSAGRIDMNCRDVKRKGNARSLVVTHGWARPIDTRNHRPPSSADRHEKPATSDAKPKRVVGFHRRFSDGGFESMAGRANFFDLFHDASCTPPTATLMLPKRRGLPMEGPVRVAGIMQEFPATPAGRQMVRHLEVRWYSVLPEFFAF